MCVCVCVKTSVSQSRAVVVYREVTLALGDPSFADYHKARVSGERRKEAEGSTCLHFWAVCLFRLVPFVDYSNPTCTQKPSHF